LCNNCNSGLGYFSDNVSVLVGAIEYLERFHKRVVEKKNDPEKVRPVRRDVQLRWQW
jgi:hypothetical protein